MKTLTIHSYNRRKPIRVSQKGSAWSNFVERVQNFLRMVLVFGTIAGIAVASFWIGRHAFPIVKTVEAEAGIPPILVRIAHAESLGSHYCTPTLVKAGMCGTHELGQVLTHPNDNHTVDVGKYQINVDTWGAKATQMGLNLFVEEDNEKMAVWIYENLGTSPWASSQARWK